MRAGSVDLHYLSDPMPPNLFDTIVANQQRRERKQRQRDEKFELRRREVEALEKLIEQSSYDRAVSER